ncbi:15562_t:CDS:1, partial [Dentiscutata heterogama]
MKALQNGLFSASSLNLDIDKPNSSLTEAGISSSNPTNNRKKRKNKSNSSNRINKSHTTYFFSRDPNNNDIAYCMICKNLANITKESYPYNHKGSTATNMASHLQKKHGIIKQNYR